jgi:hypothetical protein
MIKNKKRALRRHHQARRLARTRRIVRLWFSRARDEAAEMRLARKLRDNLKFCRCYACRNPRCDGFPPIQEQRAAAALRCEPDEP